jgi:hypothetical protein
MGKLVQKIQLKSKKMNIHFCAKGRNFKNNEKFACVIYNNMVQ